MKSSAATVQVAVCGALTTKSFSPHGKVFSVTYDECLLAKNSVVLLHTAILGNGQCPCCPLPCEFSQKCYFCENSSLFYLPAFLGGGGTDAASYKPHDVCVSKLEFTSIQGRMLVNMMDNLKSAKRILNASTEGRGAEAPRCLRQQTQSSRMYTEVHS